jgi:hypothetical protein
MILRQGIARVLTADQYAKVQSGLCHLLLGGHYQEFAGRNAIYVDEQGCRLKVAVPYSVEAKLGETMKQSIPLSAGAETVTTTHYGETSATLSGADHFNEAVATPLRDALKKMKDAKEVQASKNDQRDCKPDYSLIPESFMNQVAFTMLAGMYKYARENYRKGHSSNQLTSATVRHAKRIEAGEDIDKDTTDRLRDGCTDIYGVFHKGFGDKAPQVYHWGCIAANALMAIEQITLGTHKDDRYKKESKE